MNNDSMKDKIENVKEWVSEHAKIVMPATLLTCVLITVGVAVNANKEMTKEMDPQIAEVSATVTTEAELAEATQAQEEEIVEPTPELEENAHPEVNTLISSYYAALAAGDIEAVTSMNNMVDEKSQLRIQEMSKYIDSYPELNVYTKIGPIENSYLAYVYSKVKFTEYDELVPGMQAFYICTDENGACYINEKEDDATVTDYIRTVSLQGDVVDLNNQVAVEYNELLESDDELKAFLADLGSRIDASVGTALAEAEKQAEAEAAAAASESQGQITIAKRVRATDVVNIRSSDSETADKKGKAQIGDEFDLLEQKGNGWSKVKLADGEGYIKSEYLQVIEEELVDAGTVSGESQGQGGGSQKVRATDVVNIRNSDSETADKKGQAQIGDEFTLLEQKENGWSKVKLADGEGYIKSEYLQVIQTELADAGAVTQESQEQETVPEENQQQEAEGEENEQQEAVLQKVRATTVVNIRSSDNEAADKKGQAQTGQEFILLEQQGNGWSKVKLTDGEGYIKSEYLQAVSDTDAESTPSEASSNSEAKTVTVIENVNVRKSASENAERLGLVYMGEKLELIMKQADGWTKVKYKGQTAYVKSEYVK